MISASCGYPDLFHETVLDPEGRNNADPDPQPRVDRPSYIVELYGVADNVRAAATGHPRPVLPHAGPRHTGHFQNGMINLLQAMIF